MKYVDDFRDPVIAHRLAREIHGLARRDRTYRLMEFCGGHTHAIFRYGLHELLPENVEFVHGPGCPVCVLPASRIDLAMTIALLEGVILCSFGDVLRVPGAKGRTLLLAKAQGADVRMVYSPMDALRFAERNPDRIVVFFAVGFETTAPSTAAAASYARGNKLSNFFIHCNHVLTPSAIQHILESPELRKWGPQRSTVFSVLPMSAQLSVADHMSFLRKSTVVQWSSPASSPWMSSRLWEC